MVRGRFGLILGLCLLANVAIGAPKSDINCAADIAGCCCLGARGNVDCDFENRVDIVDLTLLIDHLYVTLEPLPSHDEANIDGEGRIDISDVTRLIDFLFISLAPLPDCPGPVNHPPVTRLIGIDTTMQPYINTVVSTPTNPGIHLVWSATDKLDHPYEPPPFAYEWRVYGPYDSALIPGLYSQFVKVVFVTNDNTVLPRNLGLSIVYCDTSWFPPNVVCDTMLVDTVHTANLLGRLDTIFNIEDPNFKGNPTYNKIALQSGSGGDSTTTDTSIDLVNLYRNDPSDTTVFGYFVFWVRAIDHDPPSKADPTPPFVKLGVIDGKHENDVLIADAQIYFEVNARIRSVAEQYWADAIARWRTGATSQYHIISQSAGNVLPLALMQKYKIMVVVNDEVLTSLMIDVQKRLIAGTLGGTNTWVAGRALFTGSEFWPPSKISGLGATALGSWMALTEYASTGWHWYAAHVPSVRIEDFVGADPIDSAGWPILNIDSGYLHNRYRWGGNYYMPWIDSLAALPEVVGFSITAEPEVLYLHNSRYTGHHPVLPDSFFFDGQPVVYRMDRTGYRHFVSAFTPYALAGDSTGGAAQIFIDSTLNWLYEPFDVGPRATSAPSLHSQSGRNRVDVSIEAEEGKR